MSARIIEQFAQVPAPGFRCHAAPYPTGPRFLAKVQHILHLPASPEAIAQILQLLGARATQVAAFYQRHNGFVLYRDTLSEAAGVELLPVEHWQTATEEMRYCFENLADEPENDPDHILSGMASATVPHSGNYFVMPVEGPTAGKIFYANHDGWYESAFADDFDKFLARVTQEPVHLLAEELGCYTRYSDGKTNKQWIPEEYFTDVRRVQL
jgi:hypothetical protein